MKTIRLSINKKDIKHAGEIIKSGGLVAFPTETVYGLGADAFNAEAVASIYEAKGRPSDNPMIVHIAEIDDIDSIIEGGLRGMAVSAEILANQIWPGPLTMVLPKNPAVPDVTTGGLSTVAVRMPLNETARNLIKAAGTPIAAPSANISGRPSPTTAEDVLEDMDGRINAVIMGDQCDVGIESTVVDMTEGKPIILRPGLITKERMEALLGCEVLYDKALLKDKIAENGSADFAVSEDEEEYAPKSPGMKYTHYSPKAKVRLIAGNDENYRAKVTELELKAMNDGLKSATLEYGGNAEKAARNLFADLRKLDRQGCDIIFIRTLDSKGEGFSVMNRMLKSAGYDIVR